MQPVPGTNKAMLPRKFIVAALALLAACQSAPPLQTQASFTTNPTLAIRKPADIAVLAVEDGTPGRAAERHLEYMRRLLVEQLPVRRYSPLAPTAVDASLGSATPASGETVLSPSFLKRVAGKATEDAILVVRVDRWDERQLVIDKTCAFQLQAALVANDGEILWNGTLAGVAKAGGLGAAPRDRDGMARSCAEIAIQELMNQLTPRAP
jgi:hypothetical protein